MERIRILLGEMAPPLSQELSRVIAAQSDLEMVGAPNSRGVGLLVEVRKFQPDAVMIEARQGTLPGECSHLIGEFPNLKIIAIVPHHQPALLYELRPHVTHLVHDSPTDLIASLRDAVKASPE